MGTVPFAELRHQVDLVALIGERVALKPRGVRWVGLCPFHDDHHPSLDVSARHQYWRCWSCGLGGDAVDWVRISENCTVMEAVRRLQDRTLPPPRPQWPASDPIARRAVRHRVYQALLRAAPLSDRHRQALQARGLRDSVIAANGYGTLPAGSRQALIRTLESTVGDLRGIPGIARHLTDHRWRLDGMAGLLIPVRDRQGRIQACQIRTDGETRYQWLSSAPKSPEWTGVSPGAPFHVAGHRYITPSSTWTVTEGPLKADVAAAFLEMPVIGIPGVSLWPRLGRSLTAWHPRLVVLAFDHDAVPETRARVFQAQSDLGALLVAAGIPVMIAHWDDGPKGIDDALAANVPMHYVPFVPRRPDQDGDPH